MFTYLLVGVVVDLDLKTFACYFIIVIVVDITVMVVVVVIVLVFLQS